MLKTDKNLLHAWLSEQIATIVNIPSTEIDETVPFERYGLESADIVAIMANLEDWLGCELEDSTVMYEYPTIKEFSEYLAQNYAL